MDDQERRHIRAAFEKAVNMAPEELATWLASDASREVAEGEADESIGRDAGERTLRILRRRPEDLSDTDYHHMRRVAGFVKNAQVKRPSGDVTYTRWRYALMNWGHDPLKAPPTGGP